MLTCSTFDFQSKLQLFSSFENSTPVGHEINRNVIYPAEICQIVDHRRGRFLAFKQLLISEGIKYHYAPEEPKTLKFLSNFWTLRSA